MDRRGDWGVQVIDGAALMQSLRRPGTALALASALGAAGALAVAAWSGWSVIAAARTPLSTPAPEPATDVLAGAEAFERTIAAGIRQVDGRSLFVVPPEPPPEAAVRSEPAATRYGGPALVAMINGVAWFADGRRLAAAEEPPEGDLSVLALEPPWRARVRWRGGEFDVTLFEPDRVVRPPAPDPTTLPSPRTPEPPAPEPVPGAAPGESPAVPPPEDRSP